MVVERFKLIYTVPHGHLEDTKNAIFRAGAGTYPGGKYSRVSFETSGIGQFLPEKDKGANPNIGRPGTLEKVEEMRVEIMCVGRGTMKDAVEALKKAHPYEEPAYEVYKMEDA
ncbi:MAG: putative ATP-dependent RNA helicase dhr2 [Chaenotheca gracillima]|nr:MAG: putative ATP-dependent RNA helicase dhr2 [Chaenotheca gracillima]